LTLPYETEALNF